MASSSSWIVFTSWLNAGMERRRAASGVRGIRAAGLLSKAAAGSVGKRKRRVAAATAVTLRHRSSTNSSDFLLLCVM